MTKKEKTVLLFCLYAIGIIITLLSCGQENNCEEPGFDLWIPDTVYGNVGDTVYCPFWYWTIHRGYNTVSIECDDTILQILSDTFICYFVEPDSSPPSGTDTIYDTIVALSLSEGNFDVVVDMLVSCWHCSRDTCGGGAGGIINFIIGGKK